MGSSVGSEGLVDPEGLGGLVDPEGLGGLVDVGELGELVDVDGSSVSEGSEGSEVSVVGVVDEDEFGVGSEVEDPELPPVKNRRMEEMRASSVARIDDEENTR